MKIVIEYNPNLDAWAGVAETDDGELLDTDSDPAVECVGAWAGTLLMADE